MFVVKLVKGLFWKVASFVLLLIFGIVIAIAAMFSGELVALIWLELGQRAFEIDPGKRNRTIAQNAVNDYLAEFHPELLNEDKVNTWINDYERTIPPDIF